MLLALCHAVWLGAANGLSVESAVGLIVLLKTSYFPVGGHTLKACNHTQGCYQCCAGIFFPNTLQVWVFEENSESRNHWFWVFKKNFKIKEPPGLGIWKIRIKEPLVPVIYKISKDWWFVFLGGFFKKVENDGYTSELGMWFFDNRGYISKPSIWFDIFENHRYRN